MTLQPDHEWSGIFVASPLINFPFSILIPIPALQGRDKGANMLCKGHSCPFCCGSVKFQKSIHFRFERHFLMVLFLVQDVCPHSSDLRFTYRKSRKPALPYKPRPRDSFIIDPM